MRFVNEAPATAKLIKTSKPNINEIHVHKIKEFVASEKIYYGLGASINKMKKRQAKAKEQKTFSNLTLIVDISQRQCQIWNREVEKFISQ